jgi:hypothetical protein
MGESKGLVRFSVFNFSQRRLLVFFACTLLYYLAIHISNIFLTGEVWKEFHTSSDISTFFCEHTDMSLFVRQPLNTFSNIVYLITSLMILRRGWKDQSKRNKYNLISANPFYSITFGCILMYIFIASTFFHSSLIEAASKLDFSAVYSLSLFPLMYFTHRVWLLSIGVPSNTKHSKSTTTVIVVFSILYLLLTFFLPHGTENYVVLSIIIMLSLFGIVVERKDPGKTNPYYLMAAILSILFAVMWFAFDIYKILCNPNSIIQPHSLWHFFAGVSTFYFYMYIRSEKNKI